MAKTFHEFYECMGFTKYPFRYRTAEKEDTSALFVAPPDYSVLKDVFDSAGTAIISGNRGTGKTIILFDIKSQASTKMIETYIDNYETIPLTGNLLDFYSLILQRIITEVLICLSKRKGILKKLSKDEKIFLSFLIMKTTA